MTIVQSLWSRPAQRHGGYQKYLGRWPHPRFFCYSWVISACWAHKHYGKVDLVTDDDGARWLVDTLKLPFNSIRTDLEGMQIPPGLWALGKIATYALQQEPFFHIDGDVYLTGRLPPRFERADLVCQLFEQSDYPGFDRVYDQNRILIEKSIPRLPGFWRFMGERSAGNCGVFGGSNVSAIRKYAGDVMNLMIDPENAPAWRELPIRDGMNCVIEQQALWCSAREQGLELLPLFDRADFRSTEALRLRAIETNFNHAAVEGKNQHFGHHLAERVKAEYPQQFEIIDALFPRTFADLELSSQVVQEDDAEGTGENSAISRVEILHFPDRRPPP